MEYGAQTDGRDECSKTPLFYACRPSTRVSRQDRIDIIRLLIKEGAAVDAKDGRGDTALHCIVRQGTDEESVVEELIAQGADAQSSGYHAESLFSSAMKNAPASILKILRWHGLDRESENGHGLTSLQTVLTSESYDHNREKRALALISSGANLSARDHRGRTVLHLAVSLAVREQVVALVQALLDGGADIDAIDSDGTSVLYLAVFSRCLELVETLIKRGVTINILDLRGQPALIRSIQEGQIDMARILLAGGADPNAKESMKDGGKNAITLAAYYDRVEIAELLVTHGADVRPVDRSYQSRDPFFWAVRKGSVSMLSFLLRQLNQREIRGMQYLWAYIGYRDPLNTWDPPNLQKEEAIANVLRKLGVPSQPSPK